MSQSDFSLMVKVDALTFSVNTADFFEPRERKTSLSPVDEFIENSNAINRLWLAQHNIDRTYASVLLIGYFSAFESYIRALIREIVKVDPISQKHAFEKEIKFGAAFHHDREMLPEALMDEFSFTGAKNIKVTFKGLLNVQLALDERVCQEFDKICQLRHCCVHRFGKLGAKNAMRLGMDSHGTDLEKPISLNYESLQEIAKILRTSVKHINNKAYSAIIQRTSPKASEKVGVECIWKLNYEEDKAIYRKFHKVFSSKLEVEKTPPPKKMYERMVAFFASEYE